jgi:uncharacterized SAM-binding protein YcdF (DUF218 family)
MFFYLSKTLGRLADPLHLSLLLLALAVLFRLIKRLPRLRRWLTYAAVVILVVFSTGAVATLLLHPLETRHPRPAKLPQKPGAIVMLAGVLSFDRKGESYYELTESSDRFVEAVRLARRFPRALLVLSGGTGSLTETEKRESPILERLARELGIKASRIRVEERSRNTHENAIESKRLLARAKVKGPVILITSAFHMPRSVACFDKVGLKVAPWPVDYMRSGVHPGTWIPRPWSLARSRLAIKEYLGFVAYWIAGYI